LHAEVSRHDNVIDATIRSGRVRVVLVRDGIQDKCCRSSGLCGSIETTEPSFEDAFVDMLIRQKDVQQSSSPTEPDEKSPDRYQNDITVSVQGLTKRFGDFTAVQDISFEVERGAVFGLLGPNGAGKSTTFRMLCGLLAVTEGQASVAGRDLRKARARARARLGYMAQKFSLYRQLTVEQNLHFYGRAYGLSGRKLRDRIQWALDEFDLEAHRDQSAEELAGGYRQRLAMAAALLHEPDILFLDEPTSGADPLARREFWLRINGFARTGVTVIVTTHFMEEAEYCDRLLIMSQGTELAQGTPAEIRRLARTDEVPEPTIEDAFIALAEGYVKPVEKSD
jgi:ABC-2 type transport system ATP-binding protein